MAGLRIALVAAALAAGVLAPAPAQADDSWDVPASAKITVVGHGYGHGHGMSQYGAEGAARQGLGYRQILAFYYPGTELGSSTGKLRVLLTADTTPDVVVVDREGLRVRDVAAHAWVALPDVTAVRWRLTPGTGTRTVLSRLAGGSWRRVQAFAGEAQFDAGGEPIQLATPTGLRSYRGGLRSVPPDPAAGNGPGDRDTVNVVGMQSYLRGVVPLEMPASWSPAAVRAQSVAARTYAAWSRANPRRTHYDICDTTACQVYGGSAAEHPYSDAAVAATSGVVVLSEGDPAFTQFSASSGGWTAAGGAPYLVAQKDPYDDWAGNPVHDWRVVFGDRRIERAYPQIGRLVRIVVTERDGNGDWGGRVLGVRFVGHAGRVTVTGDQLRAELGLRSTLLTFRVKAA